MKKTTITISSLLFCTIALAQQGTVAAGGDAAGSGGSASYSIGQIDYVSATDGSFSVNEGLQQPYEISIVTGISEANVQLSFAVYPNPTANSVVLDIKDLDVTNLTYALFDVQGKMIKSSRISSKQTTIPMEELSKASYFLKVTDNNKEIKTFKIVKN